MSFLEKIFGSKEIPKNYEPKITVEKIEQIFEYGKQRDGLKGLGDANFKKFKVGDSIEWRSEGYFYKGYKDIPAQTVPPHIKWQTEAISVFVAIVDNKVVYYYNDQRNPSIIGAPITTNVEHLRLIDEIFEHYYQKFNLPDSLNEKKTVKKKADKSDKMKFLSNYLTTKDKDFFYDNFCEGNDIYTIVMWIDWREEDENIITYCENILQTKQLSVETIDAENERGFDTIITYKGQQTSIPYKGKGADRDTTIKTLNEVIKPNYEIRFCKESDGSDTLCFIPLTASQWLELETKFKKQTERKFEKILNDTKIFN